MKIAVCIKQGNGSHRYLSMPSGYKPNDGGPKWCGGFASAHDFGSPTAAQEFIDTLPPEHRNLSGEWLGKCGQPFITTKDLP